MLHKKIIDIKKEKIITSKAENFIKIVQSSAFCSEDNKIVNDNFKIIKNQKIGIIPPISGG